MRIKVLSSTQHDEWLKDNLASHSRLSPAVVSLLQNVLRERRIDHLSVTSRIKDYESTLEKINRKNYKDPVNQLTDLTGLRVIVYFDSQVKQCIEVIRSLFLVDEPNSLDQADLLGPDRIGYRSTHFVCSLGAERSRLPEYESIANLKFEIQIRTVLQHAWAELAHDRSYKFGPGLPPDIQRELNLYSGLLEIADRAFDKIASGIQNYQEELGKKTLDQLDQVPINVLSLVQYVAKVAQSFDLKVSNKTEIKPEVIRELEDYGISNIGDLEKLQTEDFRSAYVQAGLRDNFGGFLRSMIMFEDLKKYFSSDIHWGKVDKGTFNFLKSKYPEDEVRKILSDADMDLDFEEQT